MSPNPCSSKEHILGKPTGPASLGVLVWGEVGFFWDSFLPEPLWEQDGLGHTRELRQEQLFQGRAFPQGGFSCISACSCFGALGEEPGNDGGTLSWNLQHLLE